MVSVIEWAAIRSGISYITSPRYYIMGINAADEAMSAYDVVQLHGSDRWSLIPYGFDGLRSTPPLPMTFATLDEAKDHAEMLWYMGV